VERSGKQGLVAHYLLNHQMNLMGAHSEEEKKMMRQDLDEHLLAVHQRQDPLPYHHWYRIGMTQVVVWTQRVVAD